MKRKILILGSNGYFGEHFYFGLDSDIDVICADIQDVSYYDCSHYTKLDITKKSDLALIPDDADILLFFAGLNGPWKSIERYEDFILTNEIGLINVLNRLKDFKSKPLIVYPSSRLIYKSIEGEYLNEDAALEFNSIYAINKFAAESLLKLFRKLYGINYLIFRICLPYGDKLGRTQKYGIINKFIDNAKNHEDITIYGDGEQSRTITHIEDIVNIILKSIFRKDLYNDIYNIGSNDNLTIIEIAKIVARKFGVKIIQTDWPDKEFIIKSQHTFLDSEKIIEALDYKYKYKFTEWLKSL